MADAKSKFILEAEDRTQHAIRSAERRFQKFTRQMQTFRNAFVGAFAVHEIAQFGSALIDANVKMQRIHFTLEAVTGSSMAAGKEFKYISDVSQRLGLDLQTAAQGYARLAVSAKSAGLSQQQLHRAFLGLADTFTVLHTPAADVNGLLVQLEQGLSLGKLQMQDFRAIAQHLPGTLELAKQAAADMGGSLANMLKHGGVPAEQFFIKFTDLLRQKFGPEAVKASQGLNAQINRLHTTIFQFELQISQGGFLTSVTQSIKELTKELQDPAIQQGIENLASGLGKIMQAAVSAAAKIGELGQDIGILLAKAHGVPDANNPTAVAQHRVAQINDQLKALKDAQANGTNTGGVPTGGDVGLIMNAGLRRNRAVQNILQQLNIQGGATEKNIQAAVDRLKRERAAMQQSVADLKKHGGTFGFAAPGSGGSGQGKNPFLPLGPLPTGGSSAPAAATVRAQYNAQIKLVKEKLSEQQSLLDAQHQQDLVGLKQYYAQKIKLQQDALNVEISAKRKELAAEKTDTSKTAAAKQKKLIGDINVLEQRRGFIAQRVALEQAAAEKKVTDSLKGVRQQLLQDQGKTAEAAKLQIEQQYQSLLKQLERDSNDAGVKLVKSLINAEALKSQLQAMESQYQRTLAKFSTQQSEIQRQEKYGNLSAAAGQKAIVQAYQATSDQLTPLLDKMRKLATASGNPQAIANVKKLGEQLKATGEQAKHTFKGMDQFVVQAARNMEQSFSTFFFDAMQGQFDNLATSFKKTLDKMVANALAAQLGNKLFGTGFSSGKSSQIGGWLGSAMHWLGGVGQSIGSFLGLGGGAASAGAAISANTSALASMFHSGGLVGMPAPLRGVSPFAFAGAPRLHSGSNVLGLRPGEVPAILQTGEQVLSRKQVQQGRGPVIVNNHFNIHAPQGTVSRQTQSQIAAAAGAAVNTALRRNR